MVGIGSNEFYFINIVQCSCFMPTCSKKDYRDFPNDLALGGHFPHVIVKPLYVSNLGFPGSHQHNLMCMCRTIVHFPFCFDVWKLKYYRVVIINLDFFIKT